MEDYVVDDNQLKEIEELRAELDRLKKKNGFLEQQIRDLINERGKIQSKLVEYQKALRAMEERYQKDSNVKELEKLRKENEKLRSEVEALSQVVESLQQQAQN